MRTVAVCALALAGLLSACASTTESADTGYVAPTAAAAPPEPAYVPPPAPAYQAPPPPAYVPPAEPARSGERG
jgi:hypothetical protein